MNSVELVERLKARHALRSNYAVAKFLGVYPSTVTSWQKGRSRMDDKLALKVAEALEMDPGEVLASLYAERTDCPEVRKVWEHVAERMHAA